MPKNLFPLDNTKKFTDQKHVGTIAGIRTSLRS